MVIDLMRIGCSGYIDKPFNDDILVSTVKELLSKRKKEQVKLQQNTERFNNKYRSLMNHVSEAKRSYNDLVNVDLSKMPAKICVKNRPLEDLGGDFFDFAQVRDGFVMIIADVSGHDMGAAYYTVLIKAFFEEFCSHFDNDVSSLFSILNQALSTTGMARMITAQIAYFNLIDSTVTFQNAGHPSAFRVSSSGDSVQQIISNQPVIGVIETAQFESITFSFQSGERFFFFTDGLADLYRIDGESGKKSVLSQDGVERIIIANASLQIEHLTEKIWQEALSFSRFKPHDDILLLGIELGGTNV